MKHAVVELPTYRIFLSDWGHLIHTIHRCSFGREGHRTPLISGGSISLTQRHRVYFSDVHVEVRYALFFEQYPDLAIHEGSTCVASHGCVHLEHDDAAWLFHWAGQGPLSLDIIGPYPESPVPVHQLAASEASAGLPSMRSMEACVGTDEPGFAHVGSPSSFPGDSGDLRHVRL